MSNKTKKKLQGLPFERVKDIDPISEELEMAAFKKLEMALKLRKLLRNERFRPLLERYFKPWPFALADSGKSEPFVTAQLDPETEVVMTSVNKAFLSDVENRELILPFVRSAVSSVDDSYKSLLGLGLHEDSVIKELIGTPDRPKTQKKNE